jgi:hypothetical protein
MGPIHLYLAAWVAGGVLLGASMLLDGRENESDDNDNPFANPEAFGERPAGAADTLAADAPQEAAPGVVPVPVRHWLRARNIAPLGLIGFGLAGLTAKGFELDRWPWSFVGALMVGASLIALGYRLSRSRTA